MTASRVNGRPFYGPPREVVIRIFAGAIAGTTMSGPERIPDRAIAMKVMVGLGAPGNRDRRRDSALP
jgi:hypothetical protein